MGAGNLLDSYAQEALPMELGQGHRKERKPVQGRVHKVTIEVIQALVPLALPEEETNASWNCCQN